LLNTFLPYIQHLEPRYVFTIILISNIIIVTSLFSLSIYLISKYKIFQQYRINPDVIPL
jgi:hypothetical protein